MSVSTKFVPRLQQSAGGPGRFWKWQNKLTPNQLSSDSFSTSTSLEASGGPGRWWRWQNKDNLTAVNVNGSMAAHTNGFSTSQSVGRMVETQSMMGIVIPETSTRRIPPLYKIDEEFSEILSPEYSTVHQEWRLNPGCEMSWHSRQTCGGQVFAEKTSIPLPQSKNLLQQEAWTL